MPHMLAAVEAFCLADLAAASALCPATVADDFYRLKSRADDFNYYYNYCE